MWIDLFMTAPVTVFLLWLYWYSAPSGAPRWSRVTDVACLVLSPLAAAGIIVLGHALRAWPGAGLNVMLVAAAYLSVVAILGAGWLLRFVAAPPKTDLDSRRNTFR